MGKKKKNVGRKTSSKPAKSTKGPVAPNKTVLFVAAAIAAALVAAGLWFFLSKSYPEIDGERAYRHIENQVAMGPRITGWEGHDRAKEYIVKALHGYADQVMIHRFTYRDRKDTTVVYEGENIVASFNLEATDKRILLGAHWDTRPTADEDPDPANRSLPVPGANDGASGVAVLLEIARVLSEQPPSFGVEMVFFDLEDIGDEDFTDQQETGNPFAIGSQRFVEEHPDYWPTYGIVVDMVGDRNLRIPKEGASVEGAKWLVDRVWEKAEDLGADAFVDEVGQVVYDDHAPFLIKGIPVINIIHWPFPEYWHTLEDTPDKCSPESLKQVGDVVLAVLYD